jgi:hypothetical protein
VVGRGGVYLGGAGTGGIEVWGDGIWCGSVRGGGRIRVWVSGVSKHVGGGGRGAWVVC